MPNRSISAAANGAVRPYRIRLTPTATDSSPRDQPNSSCSGTISTPGADRNPAAPINAMSETPATIQAGCSRRRASLTPLPGRRPQLVNSSDFPCSLRLDSR